MTAKEYLQQYEKINIELKLLESEKKELHNMLYSISVKSGERVQQSRSNDRLGTIYARVEQKELQIEEKLGQLLDMRMKIFDEINMVPDERYKSILYQRYILLRSWDEIAEEMYICARQVFKLHGKALEVFQEVVIDCVSKSG